MFYPLLWSLALVLISVSVQAFEIQNLGADFSVETQFEAKIYFENKANEVISIQQNNDFGYFNRFTKINDQSYKWDLVFDRTGRSDINKIVIIFPDTVVRGNTVTINKFTIDFIDAVEQGFTVKVKQLSNDSQVIISNFSHIIGIVTIDPTIIDSSALSKSNYGNAIVRDSSGNIFIVHEELVTASNTDIFVSKSTNDGNSFTTFNITNTTDKNELLPHIDINSDDSLIIAYDVLYDSIGNTQAFVTTCSSGGCDSSGDFLDDINVSACAQGTRCSNSNIVTDVNDTSHLVYWDGDIKYRSNTGFVGSSWGVEEGTGVGGTVNERDGVGILVAKNGDDRKLVFSNTDSAQVRVGYFNTFQWTALQLDTDGIQEPAAGFAGYDGNFYVVYTKTENIIFRQCDVTTDCNVLGNWTSDVNVTNGGLEREFVSMFQSADLNLHVYSSPTVGSIDVNIMHFVRIPNNSWVTSSIADANLLVSDSNRTYNPLVRSRGYDGSVLPLGSLPSTGNLEFDFVYLTSDMTTGDPSTLIFDSNLFLLGNSITASFTTNPASPISLDPESGINNVQVDLNSTTTFFGAIVDINYNWQIDSNAIGVSTDVNLVWDFNGGNRDINVSLIVQGNDGSQTFTSQVDQNVLLRLNAQDIDINFVFNPITDLADINYGVTADGVTSQINYAVWGFPNDNNLLGLQVAQQYRVGDTREVCVVVNTVGDINKLRCETFFNTRVIVKIPLNIADLAELTPFDVSVNTVPAQSFSAVSADQNFWFFFQGTPSPNTFNVVTDANVDFQVSNNLILLNQTDLNQTIQPYMSAVADGGISVIFTAKDSITDDIIPNLIIFFSRTVTGVGNTLVQSGVTDSFGRLSLSFIPNIDHNFTAEFPIGTIIKTGVYVPETIDATNGVTLLAPSGAVITDANAVGAVDVNFLQVNVRVKSDGEVDLNQIVTTDRNINSVTITVDHNSVNLFTDVNITGVANGGFFSQSIDVNGLSRLIPLVVSVTILFTDGNTFISSRGITIVDTPGLTESLVAVRAELGETAGTMILLAFIVAILLGFYHLYFPSPTGDTSSSFILVAVIFSLATVVGWVDGVSWIFATLAGGAIYFLQRVNK